jgi:alkaline phosphatase D
MKPTRRELLKGLAAAGFGAGIGVAPGCAPRDSRNPWPDVPWTGPGEPSRETFPQGAQAGDPRTDALYCTTKVVGDAAVTLHYALWVDGGWTSPDPIPVPRDTPFAQHDLIGLPPDTSVWLCFVTADGRRSSVVRARTAPAPGARGAMRLVLNACDHVGGAPYHALSNVVAFEPVDLHVHLGDAAYCDGSRTLEQFRAVWARTLEHDGYIDLFAAAAIAFTWDDHEVDNNWNPSETDPALLETARVAMHEHIALPRSQAHPDRLWRSLRFGDIAELFMLDCRGERDREGGRYIGEEQLQWLLDGLSASTATWKLIGNSVPMSSLPGPFQAPVAKNDTWHGHGEGAQRQRLLDHIAEQGIEGVLVLSGDYHMPALTRLEPDGRGSNLWEVIGGPGGSTPSPLGLLLRPTEQIAYVDAVRNLFVIDLSTDGTARIRLVDDQQVQRLDATIDTRGELLSFEMQRWADEQ